jgi:hypothetical protein
MAEGKITNGQLSFIIGTPYFYELCEDMLEDVFSTSPKDMNISTTDLKGFVLLGLHTDIGVLFRGFYTDDTTEHVYFVYVDRDVSISAEENIRVWGTVTYTRFAYNITLKKGWNAIHEMFYDVSDNEMEITVTYANPATMRWVYDGSTDGW